MKRVCLIVFLLVCCGWGAEAHLNSLSYSTILMKEKSVHIHFRYTYLCTIELFQVDTNKDKTLSADELATLEQPLFYYLNNKIKVLSGGRQLEMQLKNLRFVVEDEEAYTVCELDFVSEEPLGQVILFCNVSEEVDPFHRHIAEIKMDDEKGVFFFKRDNYFDSQASTLVKERGADTVPAATEPVDIPK
jgi:hypothetical protein